MSLKNEHLAGRQVSYIVNSKVLRDDGGSTGAGGGKHVVFAVGLKRHSASALREIEGLTLPCFCPQ